MPLANATKTPEGSTVLTAYRPIVALNIAVMLVVTGQGLLNTIVPLSAKIRGYSEFEIGLLSSAYFVGMLIGAMFNPRAVRHAGHVRAFTASIALATITALAYLLAPDAAYWIALRAIGGFAIAGLYATVEGWLQGKSDNSTRGTAFALYSVVQYVAWGIGNMLLHVAEPTSVVLFIATAMFFSSGILPLTVTEQDPPERPASPKLPFLKLLREMPVGVVGVFLIGFANGPMFSLAPVFGNEIGLTSGEVGNFMICMTIGSALVQLPIGRVSDAIDRRLLVTALASASVAVEIALWLTGARLAHGALYALAALLGAVVSTQYYVLVTHINDGIPAARSSGVSAVMLFSYCLGAIVGPSTAAAFMAGHGPSALYLHNALPHALIAIMVLANLVLCRSRVEAPDEAEMAAEATADR
ncbi:MAG: MFS transporter [Ancalomicrobiaceae bacterium]|nr:MFS transporter [Ancalomicrobiaceae bacterium]